MYSLFMGNFMTHTKICLCT